MRTDFRLSREIALFFLLVMPTVAVADEGNAPLNYFLHSYGPAATPVKILDWVLTSLCIAVCITIALLLFVAIFHKRPVQEFKTIGKEGEGLGWIYIGTGISTAILFAVVVYVLITLDQVAKPPTAPALTLTVTGYDWWWKVQYENTDPKKRFVTANEIHIPVGKPVVINLKSADVIHAFWVPVLAGKTQMIPGLANQQWLEADVTGVYHGQCTQYCGAQHAHMAFEVVAENESDFRKWQAGQLRPGPTPDTADTVAGQTIFMSHCAACHAVSGTGASGAHAPDLTHLQSRHMLAAGLLINTPDHLMNWIAHAQELKPGSRMPNIALSPAEASDLSAYLSTLK